MPSRFCAEAQPVARESLPLNSTLKILHSVKAYGIPFLANQESRKVNRPRRALGLGAREELRQYNIQMTP